MLAENKGRATSCWSIFFMVPVLVIADTVGICCFWWRERVLYPLSLELLDQRLEQAIEKNNNTNYKANESVELCSFTTLFISD